MKIATKKVLLWLYPVDLTERWVPISELQLVVADLSAAGQKSLFALLRKHLLIEVERRQGASQARLTDYGMTELEGVFPVLKKTNDLGERIQWSVLIFVQAPATDPQFRYLRRFLVDHHWGTMSRGVYVFPGKPDVDVNRVLTTLYRGSVYVLAVSHWIYGDERSAITSLFQLQDVQVALSGISKEVDSLLELKNANLALFDQQKNDIFLVFERLVQIMLIDTGLVTHYYKDIKPTPQLLHLLQHSLT